MLECSYAVDPAEIPSDDPIVGSLRRWMAGLPPRTLRAYGNGLLKVAEALTGSRDLSAVRWERIDKASLAAVRERLARDAKPATINLSMAAVRVACRQLAIDGLMSRDRVAELADLRGMPLWLDEEPGRYLEPAEQRGVLAACDSMRAPKFHKAFVCLMLAGGLRVGEASSFINDPRTDFKPKTGRLFVRFGKGSKTRVQFFTGRAREAIEAFLEYDDRDGYFPHPSDHVSYILRHLSRKAGVKHFTSHDLRRTYITTMNERNVDVVLVGKLVGHARPSQTASYDRRTEDRKAEVAFDPWA